MSVAVDQEYNVAEGDAQIAFQSSAVNFIFKSGIGWLLIALSILTLGSALIVILPIFIYIWLYSKTSSYVLDGDRLFIREGIILRREDEIELYRVKDVKANFSIIQQIFNNGDIVIKSTDGTNWFKHKAVFRVWNVTNARGLREELRKRVERSRKLHGVREID